MTFNTSHGSDVVAEHVNEKARWAGTHRARFVDLPAFPLGLLPRACPSVSAPPFRCMDGIDILPRLP